MLTKAFYTSRRAARSAVHHAALGAVHPAKATLHAARAAATISHAARLKTDRVLEEAK